MIPIEISNEDDTMTVMEVKVADHIDSIDKLLKENWDEFGYNFEFNLDKERYKRFETSGFLIALGAFNQDRDLVGYSVASILPHPYNPQVIFCYSDAVFLKKEYRNTSLGGRLLLETKRSGKKRGAVKMCWQVRAGRDFSQMLKEHNVPMIDEVFLEDL